MRVTLPASGTEVDVKSLSRTNAKRLGEINSKIAVKLAAAKADGVTEEERKSAAEELKALLDEKEAMIAALYPDLDFEALPNRDVLALIAMTVDYSLNVPEAEIKNWIRSGNGEQTQAA
ncbi:hypothetical protein N1030_01710 [Desulfovibrio mangrovi]|uniref:hypothetical protein n=1 Tax=Desulfovibrio mangrovi TaxID=2976983 RepID=UPI0022462196|nr:hypothetical protein [Desulfovibrio mangrovi]UZP67711.1 hypothetical protein N1030_01710 [Desulfovibrio mangrovi]